MPGAIPFDAVLFDLDGTLIATDGFWPVAADRGCQAAFAELGLERDRPTPAQWMSMVGLPLTEGFDLVFADLEPALRKAVFEHVVRAEHEALAAGGATLYPEVPHVLETLRAAGCKLGIASNCGQEYLDAMMSPEGPGLARWIDEPRCLDSPGIGDKADMVEDLCQTFGTRSAVMVGDRDGDRAAAHANGLPHIHLAHGFAVEGEDVAAEAVLASVGELPERLAGRDRWIGILLEELGIRPGRSRCAIGIGGGPCAGKRLFARDAARWLERLGVSSEVLELDLSARDLLGPEGPARADACARRIDAHRGDHVLFVVGTAILAPRIASGLDRLAWLSIDDEVALHRAHGVGRTVAAIERARVELEAVHELTGRWDPERVADMVARAENPLGPVLAST